MRIDRLTLTAFSPAFPGTVDVVLRDIEPGLVAITGANGAGKTTFLEAAAGALYRVMPSSDGADPVSYATGRESSILLEYSTADATFRSTLALDGPKRKSNALLEQFERNGNKLPLNDGKCSTYDAAISARFPSFDLFINSSFAAQGRGDEFTRRKPSQRKDLFAEFLGQQHYGVMAKNAGAAADLCADSTLRLEAAIAVLEHDTASTVDHEIDSLTAAAQTTTTEAEVRKRDLAGRIAALEAQAATSADQVAAYTSAAARVTSIETDLAGRKAEQTALATETQAAATRYREERDSITTKRDADVADAEKRIAGNKTLQSRAEGIRLAVAATRDADETLAHTRLELGAVQGAQRQTAEQLRAEERAAAALVTTEQLRDRAVADTALLDTVPCHGDVAYAGCQFLKNALNAKAAVVDLNTKLAPKAAIAERIAALVSTADLQQEAVHALATRIEAAEATKAKCAETVKLDASLKVAEARIEELTSLKQKAETDASTAHVDAEARWETTRGGLERRRLAIASLIAGLESNLVIARQTLEAATTGNQAAVQILGTLTLARNEWDAVTTTLATVQNQQTDLARRRQEFRDKTARLNALRDRLRRVQTEYLEWLDLQKAFAKGGLPDLEIDAAGPTISATTNAILQECFGPRFTVELVTQVVGATGAMKDEFTVQVIDNQAATPEWRDIRKYSGGQKTILQEALMCAICLYVNERSPMPIRTLWRDETGSALDAENALRYVAMLRKVRELGGFHHVLFISHNADAAAQADAQIHVGDGTARVVLPPFAEAA